MSTHCPDFAHLLREQPPDDAIRDQVARCFYPDVERAARRVCKDRLLAEDVAQEAMALGLGALHTYRGDAPLLHWLRRLVVSACSRFRRGRKNDPRLHLPLDAAGTEGMRALAADPAQELQILLEERLRLLALVLDAVPEPNRTLLLRHEGEDAPLSDLAAEYDLSVDAVKARLKRTRAQVRGSLLETIEAVG